MKKKAVISDAKELIELLRVLVAHAHNDALTEAFNDGNIALADTFIPWGEVKTVLYQIGAEFVRVDFEAGKMEGPKELIKKIKDGNKRLRGAVVGGYPSQTIGELYSVWSLEPLLQVLFEGAEYWLPVSSGDEGLRKIPGEKKIAEITSYVIERYPENPLKKFIEEELNVTPKLFARMFPPVVY